MRLISIVEATAVTGPLKPLLMFSSMAHREAAGKTRLVHRLITTRRSSTLPSGSDPLERAAVRSGIDFVAIPERTVGDPSVLPAMMRAIKSFGPDLVETHDSKSHFLYFVIRLLCRELRAIPWVAFHHGYTTVSMRVRIYQQLDRISLRFATRINTLCQPFANDLVARGMKSGCMQVLTNTVEYRDPPGSEEIDALRRSFGAMPTDCVFLSVGRLSREKGHAELIRAINLLPAESRLRLRVIFAGSGPESGALQEMAASWGDRIRFLGHIADPWPLYHAADAFVLPSHSEGSPLVMFEAMAAGLPIVASAVGGIPEVLEDGRTAMLVPPREIKALAAAMKALSVDVSLRLRISAAAKRELSRYEPAAYCENLWKIYAEALRTSGREIS